MPGSRGLSGFLGGGLHVPIPLILAAVQSRGKRRQYMAADTPGREVRRRASNSPDDAHALSSPWAETFANWREDIVGNPP